VRVEVVVSMDGEDPGLAQDLAALRDPRVVPVARRPGGRSAARNAGVAAASLRLVAFLDDDDRLLPGGLSARVAALRRHPHAVLVHGRPAVMDAEGREVPGSRAAAEEGAETCGDGHREQWEGRSVVPSTVLLRREVIERAGGFDEDLPTGEDWLFFLRAADVGPFVRLPLATVLYRRHAGQARGDPRAQEEALPRWTARYFDDPRTPPEAAAHRRRLVGRHLNWIARNHRRLGDTAAADRCFSRAVALDPSLLLHPRRLARWLALRGRRGRP
jgi:glycosyltransferase involved in cell wall biosynthesis